MKKMMAMLICVTVGLASYGCQSNKTRVAEGAVIGAVVGAAGGGIIGHQSGHGGEGAGIGAAVGALTGALVGSQIEKQDAAASSTGSQSGAAVNPSQMTTQQIIDLSKQGVHEDVIIDKIRLSNSRFVLTADDIANLKQQGVSDKVISAMQGA